jgi:FkbM family methyltransferase
MLISIDTVKSIIQKYNINITGILHIGAHDCEELEYYNLFGVKQEDVVWIDAIPEKVQNAIQRGIPNVYHAVITDKDDEDTAFHITNNNQSSSVLEFGTHATEHPNVVMVDIQYMKSITIDSFIKRKQLVPSKYNFWNLDIQGMELTALKSAIESLKYVKLLYLEVNEKELYKKCGLIDELDVFLLGYNFKRIHTHMTEYGWGDAIYVFD